MKLKRLYLIAILLIVSITAIIMVNYYNSKRTNVEIIDQRIGTNEWYFLEVIDGNIHVSFSYGEATYSHTLSGQELKELNSLITQLKSKRNWFFEIKAKYGSYLYTDAWEIKAKIHGKSYYSIAGDYRSFAVNPSLMEIVDYLASFFPESVFQWWNYH